jgi:transcriptional regulator with XRE-family HTH domain
MGVCEFESSMPRSHKRERFFFGETGMNFGPLAHDKNGVATMDKKLEVKIGPTLIRLMNEQGLSLKELSFSSGVPLSTISHMRRNRQPRDISTVMAVARSLHVSLFYLLYGQDEPSQKSEFIGELMAELFSGAFEIRVKKIRNKS